MMITRTRPWGLLLAAALAALLTLLGWQASAALAQEPEETQLCPSGEPTLISGEAPATTALLLRFAGRVVGGGTVAADGRYQLTLTVGAEPPGRYPVVVARRSDGRALRTLTCVVPDGEALRTLRAASAVPTATQIPPTSTPAIAAQAPLPPTPAGPTATPAAIPPTPAATATPAPAGAPLAQIPPPTATPAQLAGVQVVELPPAVTPALEAAPVPQATTLTMRASYDRNQNKTGDVDEGIAGLTVVVSNAGGQLLGQALTDETGAAELTVRALPGERLTVAIPSFAVAQPVVAGAQPQPVVISRVAPLPALLP
ncbi:MAG TPA: hypothetical protein VFS21_19790 [Roseiflexaceae bacterium]|nr:hypothetical protein [Roseiflexaceae bacterium]